MLKVTVHDGEDTERALSTEQEAPLAWGSSTVTQEQGDRQRVGRERAAALSLAELVPSGTQALRNAPPPSGQA